MVTVTMLVAMEVESVVFLILLVILKQIRDYRGLCKYLHSTYFPNVVILPAVTIYIGKKYNTMAYSVDT